MPLEERFLQHPSMLYTTKTPSSNSRKHEKQNNKHDARSVIVFSSADSMSRTLDPTFSIIPAPFSYRLKRNNSIYKNNKFSKVELDYPKAFDHY